MNENIDLDLCFIIDTNRLDEYDFSREMAENLSEEEIKRETVIRATFKAALEGSNGYRRYPYLFEGSNIVILDQPDHYFEDIRPIAEESINEQAVVTALDLATGNRSHYG